MAHKHKVDYRNEIFKIAFENSIEFSPLNTYFDHPLINQEYMRIITKNTLQSDKHCHKTYDEYSNEFGVRVSGPLLAIIFKSTLSLDQCKDIYNKRVKQEIINELDSIEKVDGTEMPINKKIRL